MKKILSLTTLLATFSLHAGLSAAVVEVQVEKLPSQNEGTYYNSPYPNTNQGTLESQQNTQSYYNQDSSLNVNTRIIPTLPPGSSYSTGYRSTYVEESKSAPVQTQTYYDQGTAPGQGPGPATSRFSHVQRKQDTLPNGVERTLAIIKPDAVQNNRVGEVISRLEKSGLKIAAIKMVVFTPEDAKQFYFVHRERPFYPSLVDFMSSGPSVVLVLEGRNAIAKHRHVMGVTDPQRAEPGTIRADFGESVSHNAIHGSDSPETAADEILFFFKPEELYIRN